MKILFVCVENSNRSQMAEAFARMHAPEGTEALSAGSKPSGRVNAAAVESMRERGYDLSRHHSKSLDSLPEVEFDMVVTMGCGDSCPHVRARERRDWDIPDPKGMGPDQFRAVRDLIETKVKQLFTQEKR